MLEHRVGLMHHFPGVPWDAWPDMPYELVLACIESIDGSGGV